MIRYTLICDGAHEFESWFSSSASFEEQARRGLVACPVCDSVRVERGIMSPNLARTDRGKAEAGQETSPADRLPESTAQAVAAPMALMGEKEIAFRQMLVALHAHVAENAENVGKRFAEEAVKIHHGESEGRAIYGEATPEDAQMLQEEGIAFMPLPRLPGARN